MRRRGQGEGPRKVSMEWLAHWTYTVQKAEFLESAGLYLAEASADGAGGPGDGLLDSVERVRMFGDLGANIRGSGSGRGDVHPDAEQVKVAVSGLDTRAAWLVKVSGLSGLVPWWVPKGTRVVAIRNHRGKPVIVYDGNHHANHCLIRIIDPPETIRTFRRRYCRWWTAMWVLSEHFRRSPGLLKKHRVVGVSARPFPWLEKAATNSS